MLERRSSANGVVCYVSPLLESIGVPHAFSTRIGGVSPPPFDRLNLGNPNGCPVQDDYQRIWENYRLLQAAIGCESRRLARVHQVHGCQLAHLAQDHDDSLRADALITSDARWLVSVRVADCVPVLLASADGKVVAAVHAGWRGVVAGIVPKAIAAVQKLAGPGTAVTIAIGPCISGDAYEVGPEVLEQFTRCLGNEAPISRRVGGKGYVDLRQAIRLQALGAGLPPKHIDTTDRCTYRHAAEFFSHRRENGITGRMAAIIATRA